MLGAATTPVVRVETFDAVTMQQIEHTQIARTVTTETSLESTGESYSWLFFMFRVTPFMDYFIILTQLFLNGA